MVDNSHIHNETVDVWSVGVLAFELLSGVSPFSPQQKVNNFKYVETTTK